MDIKDALARLRLRRNKPPAVSALALAQRGPGRSVAGPGTGGWGRRAGVAMSSWAEAQRRTAGSTRRTRAWGTATDCGAGWGQPCAASALRDGPRPSPGARAWKGCPAAESAPRVACPSLTWHSLAGTSCGGGADRARVETDDLTASLDALHTTREAAVHCCPAQPIRRITSFDTGSVFDRTSTSIGSLWA